MLISLKGISMLVSSKGVIDYSLIERSYRLVKSKGVVKFSYSKRSYRFVKSKGKIIEYRLFEWRLSNIVIRRSYRLLVNRSEL